MKSTTLVMPAADLARNPNDDFISGFKECPGSKILTLLLLDNIYFIIIVIKIGILQLVIVTLSQIGFIENK